jgi:hypothetical protein
LQLLPWEYIFQPFNKPDFPDLYTPTWVASLVLLIVLGVLYWQRTKALHRHQPFLDMWEWLWWTGLITFSLLLIESLFVFDFFLVVVTAIGGIGTLVWIRFRRFPPILAAHEQRLARERYYTKKKFADPETTIRKRPAGGRRPARAQRRRR